MKSVEELCQNLNISVNPSPIAQLGPGPRTTDTPTTSNYYRIGDRSDRDRLK
ncbi:MAG: hypothetical protein WCD53_10210 [Microcoleus sp.]